MGEFVQSISETKGFEFPVGRCPNGSLFTKDIATMGNYLIIGRPGTGKTSVINSILLTLMHHIPAGGLKCVICGTRNVDYRVYTGSKYLLTPPAMTSVLESGEINHSESGENRQFQSNENRQSGVASPGQNVVYIVC